MTDEQVYFGFERVGRAEKQQRVNRVFSSVAERYDLMNDAMSLGLHRVWKRCAVNMCAVRPGHSVLDLAGGSGDMSGLLRRHFGNDFDLTIADINADMLQTGLARLTDQGWWPGIEMVQCPASDLPFADGSFDRVLIAFGLRNFAEPEQALREVYRVLRPGGRLIVLEFSRVEEWLRPLYDKFSYMCIPVLGRWIAGDEDSYRYLIESIRTHPDQQSVNDMLESAGFDSCDYVNLSRGIVAIHRAVRFLR